MTETDNPVRSHPWGLTFLLGTLSGLFLFFYRSFDDVARQHPLIGPLTSLKK